MTARDQWGETAEDRHARILKRDLAWLVVSEAHARDGVPCEPVDRLHFEAGWAACYAEYVRDPDSDETPQTNRSEA